MRLCPHVGHEDVRGGKEAAAGVLGENVGGDSSCQGNKD